MPTRKPGRPFRSLALPSCFKMDPKNSWAEHGGLSRVVQGPTASKEQGLSPNSQALENLSGPQPSFQASIVFSQSPMQISEGCHVVCIDPPPQKSKENLAHPRLLASLEDLSGPQPSPHAYTLHLSLN